MKRKCKKCTFMKKRAVEVGIESNFALVSEKLKIAKRIEKCFFNELDTLENDLSLLQRMLKKR
jgi:hypothetical protein